MAWALLTHTLAQSSDNDDITTSGIDTSGADLLILIESGNPGALPVTPSDSKSNTWTQLTEWSGINGPGSVSDALVFYYCHSPTVGTGHTFTVSATNSRPAVAILAFSGSASSPFDQENGIGPSFDLSGSNITQGGSITPTQNNELIVSAAGRFSGTLSVSVGTLQDQAPDTGGVTAFGLAVMWLTQVSATASNPTWTAGAACIAQASFKMAAASGGGPLIMGGELVKGSLIRGGRLV